MASSKVMATNQDPPRVNPSPHYLSIGRASCSSINNNMDDIIRFNGNIYTGSKTPPQDDVVWNVSPRGEPPEMTLEDFLTKAGAPATARGKRRAAAVEVPPLDKATQQKQRRMIKNRESAARSRERKQAYTVELEALVTQLEEENARLVREEAEESKKRLKQLMENLIPVEDKRKPPTFQTLRRSNSMRW